MHPAAIEPELLLRDCDVRRHRTRGPGGQHRNKTDSAIEISHRPTGVVAHATERRSQQKNLRVATFRLRVNLALDVRGLFDPGIGPSERWRSRVGRDGRIALNPEHHDFPALLAEALDSIHAVSYDVPKAARLLGCTASQLVKLLKEEPRAMTWLNAQLESRGRHRLS